MNFDGLAHFYTGLERVACGNAMQRGREALLERASGARHVLILGEGPGSTLEPLMQLEPPPHQVTVIEPSHQMRALCVRRLQKTRQTGRVRFLKDGWEEAPNLLRPAPEVLITHFFLDLLTDDQVDCLTAWAAARIAPDACWLNTEFRLPAKDGWRRWRARAMLKALYLGCRMVTGLKTQDLPDYGKRLQNTGWALLEHKILNHGFISCELWRKGPVAV